MRNRYELWAKKRDEVNYRFIVDFDDERMFDTYIDRLPREKFREAMILDRELDEPAKYVEIKPMYQKTKR